MMKIPTSIRTLYYDLDEQYSLLAGEVEKKINSFKDKNWHYIGRLKKLESFALKVETGRCAQPELIEDFFACTIVVENLHSISKAEKMVTQKFQLCERRPNNSGFTNNRSDSFKFEDLRLYVKWKDDEDTRPTGLQGLLFEVQIKSFLQHAWSIATHDLIYKCDEKNWSKERIAFQIKAMLEHAELSIQEAEILSGASSLKKTDRYTKRVSKVIKVLEDLWPDAALPGDKKRLAEIIQELITNIDLSLEDLKTILVKETEIGRGTRTLNLSPYAIIIQTLFNQEEEKIVNYLKDPTRNFKVYLHNELEIPSNIDSSTFINCIQYPG